MIRHIFVSTKTGTQLCKSVHAAQYLGISTEYLTAKDDRTGSSNGGDGGAGAGKDIVLCVSPWAQSEGVEGENGTGPQPVLKLADKHELLPNVIAPNLSFESPCLAVLSQQ